MNSNDLRRKFLEFFEERKHKIVFSSLLIPTDPSVLFTTAGMQQFKPYYLGQVSPYGPNVASCQKCFRTSDIEEVGDESHLTFLEMLGNFSFAVSAEASGEGGAGYFKETAINLAYEFLFEELKLPKENAIFTVFEGDKSVPEDKESIEIWKKLGISEDKIKKCDKGDNFWGPTGEEGPCGPTTEIHINGIEIWNLVFNEYYQDKDKKLTPLTQKGVDTGMGLERLAMVVQDKPSVFETDLFQSLIEGIEKYQTKAYSLNSRPYRIIADHAKGAVFLISEGVLPSNVERGYVLRRILRRAIRYGKLLNLSKNFLIPLAQKVIEIYKDVYPEVKSKEADILTVIQREEEKFEKTLDQGLKEFNKWFKKPIVYWGEKPPKDLEKRIKESPRIIPGFIVFRLFTTYGFPIELTREIAKERGLQIDEKGFEAEMKKHQEISRAGDENKFIGGLVDHSEKTIKYHTSAHLMLAALRQILGPEIYQKGSNITAERLRFDFNYPQKLTNEQIKKIEDLVNQKIKQDLPIHCEEMPLQKAKEKGVMGVFEEKYGNLVKVYSIGEFSKEICGGPHVERTSELGLFRIIKEESSGAGVRRIRAILK